MKILSRTLLAGAAVLAITGGALAQADLVTGRQEGLKRMSGHMQAIQAAVRGGGDIRSLAPRTEDMVTWYQGFSNYFPPGSDVPPSKALPTVWSDRAGFEQRRSDALTAAQRLHAAVQTGDAAQVGPALQGMAGACTACHRAHRGQ